MTPAEATEAAIVAERLRLAVVALDRVRALHRPSTGHSAGTNPWCEGCYEAGGYDGAPGWPCPTIEAIGDAP